MPSIHSFSHSRALQVDSNNRRRYQPTLKMSLIPLLFEDAFRVRPTRLRDQHFGMGLTPIEMMESFITPREISRMMHEPFGYIRPWRTNTSEGDSGSVVTMDKDKFQVNLDVQHFTPEEINVKVNADNEISIEGKHEEKQDGHGYISRHFVRKYVLPKGHDAEKIEVKLSSDGVLTIIAPKVKSDAIEEHRNIPIQQTRQPSKALEQNSEKSKN